MSQTTKDIADALGRAAIAKAVGNEWASSVTNYVGEGKQFPAEWWLGMKALADEKGYDLPDSAFKFAKPTPTPAPSTPKVEANGCAQ